MSNVEELTTQITELNSVLHQQYAALTQQRAVLEYLLNELEQLALDHDLEEQVDAIMVKVLQGAARDEDVNPQIIA